MVLTEELRHQLAAVIGAEAATPEDIALAAAYLEQRRAVKIEGGEIVDGDPLPTDNPFLDWVNGGAPVIAPADLPAMIVRVINRYENPVPPNIK